MPTSALIKTLQLGPMWAAAPTIALVIISTINTNLLLVEDFAVGRDGNHPERDVLAAGLQCLLDSKAQSAAAGDLHPNNSQGLDIIVF